MPFTREDAYRTLATFHPAPVFLQSYQSKRLPENLDIYFGPPEEFFIAPDTQAVYTQGRLVPMLDDGNFGVVTFGDPGTRALVQMDVEAAEDKTTFHHWQQYLADLMIRLGDSIDSDEELGRIAEIIQFAHMKEFEAFLARTEHMEDDAWWEARRRFPLEIKI